jgi:hypothetical protein
MRFRIRRTSETPVLFIDQFPQPAEGGEVVDTMKGYVLLSIKKKN